MTQSLRELLERNLAANPDRVAVSADSVNITWSDLWNRARHVAGALRRDGISARDRVLYVGKNDLRYFDMLFGCSLVGAVLVPVNWRLAPPELAAIASDAQATVAVIDTGITLAPDGKLRKVITLDQGTSEANFADWLLESNGPWHAPSADEIAFQLYTSGTTGRPKGAMFNNGRNLRTLLDRISAQWEFSASDTSLVALPLFHMGGLAWALATLAQGGRCVLVRDFDPGRVLEIMEHQRVTVAFFVPAMLGAVCAALGAAPRTLALKRIFYSGAPISPTALIAAMTALKCDFVQIYGLTEATGAFAQLPAADHDPTGPRANLLLSAGRPYPWVEVRIVSISDGQDVPAGEIGEVWTRSEQNLAGYWNDPERTANALTADGWLKTGDLGRVDGEGRIFLVDRAKDLVISGGENVYPVEVENVLAAHPALAEFTVIGVPHDKWGETVKAIVVPKAGETVDANEVIAFVRQRLAGFKCPTSVDIVTGLPRTATGKVLKHVLREPYWKGFERRIN